MLRKGRPRGAEYRWTELSAEEDELLRSAFGRFGGTQDARAKARTTIPELDKNLTRRWIYCDCKDPPSVPPFMYTRSGHIVRHHDSPAHDEHCDFFMPAVQQVRINRTYVHRPTNLAYDFLRQRIPDGSHRTIDRLTPTRRRPRLAQLLFALIEGSGLQQLDNSLPIPSLAEQFQRIRNAAATIRLTSTGIVLADVLSTFASSEDRLISMINSYRLRWPANAIRHGIIVDRVTGISEGHVEFFGGKRIPIVGQCHVFGEDAEPNGDDFAATRAPYLAACLSIVENGKLQIVGCYLHPIRSDARLSLVDSKYERMTWTRIDWVIKRSGHDGLVVMKPLHDIAPQFEPANGDDLPADDDNLSLKVAPHPVLIPDFIVRYPARHRTLVVETMGYSDKNYRQRKIRTHALMIEALKSQGAGEEVEIIEHDFHFPVEHKQIARDNSFLERMTHFLFENS